MIIEFCSYFLPVTMRVGAIYRNSKNYICNTPYGDIFNALFKKNELAEDD